MYRVVKNEGKFFCISDKVNEPDIPCESEEHAQQLSLFLNKKINDAQEIFNLTQYHKLDLLSISRNISNMLMRQYCFEGCSRFTYSYDEENDVFTLIDEFGELEPWTTKSKDDIIYFTAFFNRMEGEKQDLDVELLRLEEELNNFKGLPQAALMTDLTEDIFEISTIIGFLVENELEPELVEYVTDSIRDVLEELRDATGGVD